MPRPPRVFYPGTPAHLTGRGIDGEAIFRDDVDRYDFLHILRKVTKVVEWEVLCWCLMTTHYHLLVVVPQHPARVPTGMHRLNSTYARRFNGWHGRRGHVFGERYGGRTAGSPQHGENTVAYILDNPVRAGLVRRFDEWNWSGLEPLRPP
jgi:putative transposase